MGRQRKSCLGVAVFGILLSNGFDSEKSTACSSMWSDNLSAHGQKISHIAKL